MKNKKSIKTAMLIVLAIGLIGGALAYFSSIALTKHNIFEVFTGQKNQDGGLIIEEPSWKEPDKDDHARPGTYYAKDPSLLNNVEYDGYAVIRVRIPKVISKEGDQETAQLNEIANICYFGAPQVGIGSDNTLRVGDIVTFDGQKGSVTGDNDKGTFNSDDFSFLGKLTVREGYNDYYFGYNDVLYSNNRTENLFDYIQIKQFTELLGDGSNHVDSYVDVDAQMVQSVDTDTGYAYTSVADAWTKVFKKPADSEEFGAVDNDSEPRNIKMPMSRAEHTIIYDGNGANETVQYKQTKANASATVASNKFNKTGHSFMGWNTQPDGSGDAYTPGVQYTKDANTVFYAQWRPDDFTVTFNGNGNTDGNTDSQAKLYDKTLNIADNGFEKDGYVFLEWNTKADGSGDVYVPGSEYTQNAPLELYAQWGKDESFNIYHHHVYSGSNLAGNNTSAGSGSYNDSYYRSGSGGCFTNYYTSSTSSGYYTTNCGKTEHTHGDSCKTTHTQSLRGTEVTYYCSKCGAVQSKMIQLTKACPDCGLKNYPASSYTDLSNTTCLGGSGLNKTPHTITSKRTTGTFIHTGTKITCTQEEHKHTGSRSSGGGCYGSYHSGSTTYYYNRGCGHTDGELLYSVKYNLCGGTISGAAYSYNATANTVTMTTPSKSGYTFTGWKVGDKTYSAGEAIPVTDGMSVIATYKRIDS